MVNEHEDCPHGMMPAFCAVCRGDVARDGRSSPPTLEQLRRRFPTASSITPAVRKRANALRGAFLREHPVAHERDLDFRDKYARIFSKEGLRTADPADLRYFANNDRICNPGRMDAFNRAWDAAGDAEAASRVREVLEYLLYGDGDLEDRLTDLIDPASGRGFTGFREALLTKALCMVHPDRFLPIVKYTGKGGKLELAKWVLDLDLPRPSTTSWTIGRLIIWSNDLLLQAAGEGLGDDERVGEFLWWAKDRAGAPPTADGDAVLTFRDDDDAFLRWRAEHPFGWIVNADRQPKASYIVLHRVGGCGHLEDLSGELTWTSSYIKICSDDQFELMEHVRELTGGAPTHCLSCLDSEAL